MIIYILVKDLTQAIKLIEKSILEGFLQIVRNLSKMEPRDDQEICLQIFLFAGAIYFGLTYLS